MEMKPMRYDGSGESRLLYTEEPMEGYKLAILNIRGSHPCAYVQFPGIEELESYDDIELYNRDVPHGGFTFLGKIGHDLEGMWLGWDYAHVGDYMAFEDLIRPPFAFEHKYTTQEVVDEARLVLAIIKNGSYDICTNEDELEKEDGESV